MERSVLGWIYLWIESEPDGQMALEDRISTSADVSSVEQCFWGVSLVQGY